MRDQKPRECRRVPADHLLGIGCRHEVEFKHRHCPAKLENGRYRRTSAANGLDAKGQDLPRADLFNGADRSPIGYPGSPMGSGDFTTCTGKVAIGTSQHGERLDLIPI